MRSVKTKRVTANTPEALLKEALETTQMGITETIIRGLNLVNRTRAYKLAQEFKG